MRAIDRLAAAIVYPAEERPQEGSAATLIVDGVRIEVSEKEGRLRFVWRFSVASEAAFAQLAGFATGRLLREAAVLAWEPRTKELLLWQEMPAVSADEEYRRSFELFLSSCDWWTARVDELAAATGKSLAELMILP